LKIDTAEFVLSAVSPRQFLRDDRPQVIFAGRSNVGKSSLLNRLLKRKGLARISSTPGRTRAVNYFLINERFYFVDLPGYGYAKASKQDRQVWAELVDSYCRAALPRGQVILLVDSKVGATDLDVDGFHYLESFGGEVVVAPTKSDRLSGNKRRASLEGIQRKLGIDERTTVIPVSARSGEGLNALWRAIELHLRSSKERTA